MTHATNNTAQAFMPVEDYLARVCAVIRKHGWVKSTDEPDDWLPEDERIATWRRAWFRVGGPSWDYTVTPKDQAFAQKALIWVRGQTPTSGYVEAAVKRVAKFADGEDPLPVTDQKTAAMLAPLLSIYNEEMKSAGLRQSSRYVGTKGERMGLTATVQGKREFTSEQWGAMTAVTFVTTEGNALLWITTSAVGHLDIGKTYVAHFTVKQHETDKYTKVQQTVVKRLTVERLVSDAAA